MVFKTGMLVNNYLCQNLPHYLVMMTSKQPTSQVIYSTAKIHVTI